MIGRRQTATTPTASRTAYRERTRAFTQRAPGAGRARGRTGTATRGFRRAPPARAGGGSPRWSSSSVEPRPADGGRRPVTSLWTSDVTGTTALHHPPGARLPTRRQHGQLHESVAAATARGRTPPGSGARRLVQAGAGARGSRPACPRRRPRSCRADRPRRGGSRRWTRSPPRGRGRACPADTSTARTRSKRSARTPVIRPARSRPRHTSRPADRRRGGRTDPRARLAQLPDRRRTHRRSTPRRHPTSSSSRRPDTGEGSPSRRALRLVDGRGDRPAGRPVHAVPVGAPRGGRATRRRFGGHSSRRRGRRMAEHGARHASTRMAAWLLVAAATAVWSVCASASPSTTITEFLRRFRADPLLGRSTSHLAGRAPGRGQQRLRLLRCCAAMASSSPHARRGRSSVASSARRRPRSTAHAPPTRETLGALSPAELRRLAPRSAERGAVRLCRSLDLERLRDVPFEPSRGGSFVNAASASVVARRRLAGRPRPLGPRARRRSRAREAARRPERATRGGRRQRRPSSRTASGRGWPPCTS